MAWDNITLTLFGFSLYTLGLLLNSKSIQRLHFANFIDVSKITEIPKSVSRSMSLALFLVSFFLFGWAINGSIRKDYTLFLLLSGLGILLVSIRVFCFFCPKISFLGFEIETVTDPQPSLRHIYHSPFIIGGMLLIMLGGVTPLTFKGLLHWRFQNFKASQFEKLEKYSQKVRFKQLYIPRMLAFRDRYVTEEEFLELLSPGRRFVVTGRAGVGKTWFLISIRHHINTYHQGEKNVIYLEAPKLMPDKSIVDQVNRIIFERSSWFSQPFARSILTSESTIVIIDGFDEVDFGNRKFIANNINEFCSSGKSTIILTTRPDGSQWPKFEEIMLPPLNSVESSKAIDDSKKDLADVISEIMKKHSPVNYKFLTYLTNGDHKIELIVSKPEQIVSYFKVFLDKFKFTTVVNGTPGMMPFLSTFRDLDNAKELFVEAAFGNIRINTENEFDAQRHIVELFLLKRVQKNYAKVYADTLIKRIKTLSRQQMMVNPKTTTIKFSKEQLKEPFGPTTLDKAVLESELMVEKDGYLVFGNDLINSYFLWNDTGFDNF